MDASGFNTERPDATFGSTYNDLLDTNERLRKLEDDLSRTSSLWSLYHGGSSNDDPPVGWVNSTDIDFWSGGDEANEWHLHAENKGFLTSHLAVENELAELCEMKDYLEKQQEDLRRTLNEWSRPNLHPWHILELPDEILSLIFEYVEGFQPDVPDRWYPASPDITNCRLTCRKFCQLSSRFFIRSVSVDVTVSSMSRLDEISNHPIISKGVRSVHVILHYYDAFLGDSLMRFAKYNSRLLEERAESMDSMRSEGDSEHSKEVRRVMRTLSDIAASWRRFYLGTQAASSISRDNDRKHFPLLRTYYEKYRRLLLDQVELSESGAFVQRVAASIARMPSARTLAFLDWGIGFPKRLPFFTCEDLNELIYESTLQPMHYFSAYNPEFTAKHGDLIPKLPVAIHQLGAWIEEIDIKLSYLASPSDLLPTPEIRQQLPLAVKRLRMFSFECRHWVNHEGEEDMFSDIFSPFLSTSTLQDIKFDMLRDGASGHEPAVGVSRVMTSHKWTNLSNLFLRDVTLDPSEFRVFANVPKGCRYSLERVRLLGGTWADMLDTLRGRCPKKISLSDLLGAECDHMPVTEKMVAFGRDMKALGQSEAELYVQRVESKNPLRAQPQQVTAFETAFVI